MIVTQTTKPPSRLEKVLYIGFTLAPVGLIILAGVLLCYSQRNLNLLDRDRILATQMGLVPENENLQTVLASNYAQIYGGHAEVKVQENHAVLDLANIGQDTCRQVILDQMGSGLVFKISVNAEEESAAEPVTFTDIAAMEKAAQSHCHSGSNTLSLRYTSYQRS